MIPNLGRISGETLTKEERLLKSKDFRAVYKSGRSAKRDAVILYCRPNVRDKNRIGFSISAKIVRTAASRNKIRRLFREVYRRGKGDLKTGFDIVIVIKKEIAKRASYEYVRRLFHLLAGEAGLY